MSPVLLLLILLRMPAAPRSYDGRMATDTSPPDTPVRRERSRSYPRSRPSTGSRRSGSPRWAADGHLRLRPGRRAGRPRASRSTRSTPRRRRSAARCTSGHVFSYTHTDIDRPLPAHARQARLLPDGLGRQRPAHRAPGAELLRRALRPVAALRPGVRAARRSRGKEPGADLAAATSSSCATQLTAEDEQAFEELWRRLGLSVDWSLTLHARSTSAPARASAAGVPAQPGPRRGLQRRGADAVGRRLPHRGRPGRARGPRAARRLPPASRSTGRDGDAVYIETTRPELLAGVRRAGRPPRRRALPAAVRHDGAHAAVRRRGAGRRPPARRAREGHRHRDDLHVRRHSPTSPGGASCELPTRAIIGRDGRLLRRRRRPASTPAPAPTPSSPGKTVKQAQAADRRAAARVRRPGRRARADHPPGEVLREGRAPARDRHHRQWYIRNGGRDADLRERCSPAAGSSQWHARPHAAPLRELGRGPQRRLADQPPALLRRAVPGLVPRSTPTASPTTTDPIAARRGRAAGRPVDRRARRASPRTSAASPAASSATPTSWTPGRRRR